MALEVQLNIPESIPYGVYQLENGDRYQVSSVVERLDSAEKLVPLMRLPNFDGTVYCSLEWFMDGRFKRVYDLDDDLKTLDLMLDIFERNWCDWANNPEVWTSAADAIQAVPEICQRMKAVLTEYRGDRS